MSSLQVSLFISGPPVKAPLRDADFEGIYASEADRGQDWAELTSGGRVRHASRNSSHLAEKKKALRWLGRCFGGNSHEIDNGISRFFFIWIASGEKRNGSRRSVGLAERVDISGFLLRVTSRAVSGLFRKATLPELNQ